ncbi:MAG: hypothetical protein JNL98_45010, partial [Bryobacterales bacterium]|nr:hypothetical protein [Bryobacterales bacterium]
MRLDALLRRGLRPRQHASGDGGDPRSLHRRDPGGAASGAQFRRCPPSALADDRTAQPEGLDRLLEDWLRSYKPDELFDADGAPAPEIRALAPAGSRRMGANPHANGGILKKALRMPDFRDYAIRVDKPARIEAENTPPLGRFLRDLMKANMRN